MDFYSSQSLGEVDIVTVCNSKVMSQCEISVFKPGKFMFLGEITEGRFPIYKVVTLDDSKIYALKCFEKTIPEASISFKNEIRFSYLQHPNIVKLKHFEVGKDLNLGTKTIKATNYLMMDYHPNGSFHELIFDKGVCLSDEVIRTYFHQLIEALEYLHNQRIAHMDIKLDNLLIGTNYELKLCDFDLACYNDDTDYGLGSLYYRAPEIIKEKCTNFNAADFYSVGVVLFLLKTGGMFPHLENELYEDEIHLFDLLYNEPEKFWETQAQICGVETSFFDEDFRELFMAMIEYDPNKRAKLVTIKNSNWFKGQVLSTKELGKIMKEVNTESMDY